MQSTKRAWWRRAYYRNIFKGLAFILPWLIGFVAFTIYPLLASGYYSFELLEPLQQLAKAQLAANWFDDVEETIDRAAQTVTAARACTTRASSAPRVRTMTAG